MGRRWQTGRISETDNSVPLLVAGQQLLGQAFAISLGSRVLHQAFHLLTHATLSQRCTICFLRFLLTLRSSMPYPETDLDGENRSVTHQVPDRKSLGLGMQTKNILHKKMMKFLRFRVIKEHRHSEPRFSQKTVYLNTSIPDDFGLLRSPVIQKPF